MISTESEDLAKNYRVIRNELKTFDETLTEKREYIFLTKSDLVEPKELERKLATLKKINKNTIAISIHDWDSLEKVKKILNKIQKEIRAK